MLGKKGIHIKVRPSKGRCVEDKDFPLSFYVCQSAKEHDLINILVVVYRR